MNQILPLHLYIDIVEVVVATNVDILPVLIAVSSVILCV